MMITDFLISLLKVMIEVIVNPVPKKNKTQWSKNLCGTRGLVAKLFIAILMNYAFLGRGMAEDYPKASAMVAYFLTHRSLGAGGHIVFSS
jgi:hypothetical protein